MIKQLTAFVAAAAMTFASLSPAAAGLFDERSAEGFRATCDAECYATKNTGGINKTKLTEYDKAWINYWRADDTSGSYGNIVWIRVGNSLVEIPKKSIREAGDPVAYIEQAIHNSIVAQMQAQIEEINAANDEATEAFESEINELTQDLAETSMELLEALGEIEGLETKVADLETTIEGLEANVDDLNDDVADLKSDKEGLETQVSGLESQIDGLNAEVADLEAKLDTAIAEKNAQVEQNAELQATITEKNAAIATLEGTLAATKSSLATAEADLATAQADLATAQAALTAEQASHAITKSDLNETEAAKDALQVELDELKDEISNASLSGGTNADGTKHVVSVTINDVTISIEADFTTNAPSADDISAALGSSSQDSYDHVLASGPVVSSEITDQPNDKIKMTVTIEGVTLNGYIWTDKNNESIIESIQNQITIIAQQSYIDGYEAGYKEGYNDGYTDGYTDGYADGFADGVASVK